MGRRTIPFTQDAITRAIKAVQKAGVEIRSIRIEPDGAVVINGESVRSGDAFTLEEYEASPRGYL
ncbi:hypothetical protein SAMN05880590_11188 [Rhizobium sp. RU35A]|uniref:hypothetical protein n=1 Tax=Rhizobium sp. RU35A TaxID=1907414 RepID=UPI0009554D0C|nr:hypothetical protein [Rhizobium sp. RU35A]SIR06516.1 hypothetical protein SAMN05880590_11188 [Rhizobium sp. RU35A]